MAAFSGGDADRRIVEIYARLAADEERIKQVEKSLTFTKNNLSVTSNGGIAGKVAIWANDTEIVPSSLLTETSVLTTTGDIVPSPTNTINLGTAPARFADVRSQKFHGDEVHTVDLFTDTIDVNVSTFVTLKTNLRPNSDSGQDLGVGTAKFGTVWADTLRFVTGTNGIFITSGAGTPEGSQVADIGSVYVNRTGGASTIFYVKETAPTTSTGWVPYGAAGAGGANTALSNLVSPTMVNQHLLPGADNTYDLGGTVAGPLDKYWRDIYLKGRLLSTGSIGVRGDLLPETATSYDLGGTGKSWADLWVSQEPSRIYFEQAGITPSISVGSLTPNTNITADVGSLYMWKSGAAGSVLWIKETGSGTSGGWTAVNPAGTSPPGSDHYVIYNDAGGFGADLNFQWDKTSHALSIGSSGGGAAATFFTSGQYQGADGTAGAPLYAWQHATDGPTMGFFRQGTNSIGISTSGTEWWRIDSNGNLKSPTDNDHDIGANGLFRPRSIYAGTSVKTPYVRTPLIDSDSGHTVPVVFADTLEPDADLTRNCGSSGKTWASVYGAAFRFANTQGGPWVGTFTYGGDPNGNVTASKGAICLDSAGGQVWVKTSGTATTTVWSLVGGSAGANTTLSNLSQTLGVSNVAVNTDLLPDASVNSRLLGTLAKTWGQSWINTVNTNNLGTLTGSGAITPVFDSTLNFGEATTPRRWAQVATLKVLYSGTGPSEVKDLSGPNDPSGAVISANRGSTYRRTNGGTNTTLYVKESGDGTAAGWAPVLTSASGGGADLQLSNLTGTTAVPVDLLPAGTGLRQLGNNSHRWGGCSINSIGCTSLSGLSGSIDVFSSLISTSGVNIGSFADFFASMFATNLAVTNIVPLSGSGIAIGSGSDPVYVILGGVPKRITTVNTGVPLYVA